jgi:hypothetical protein
MRSWKLMALALGVGALLFTARPAQAQVFIGPPAPVLVGPAPVVVGPSWGYNPYWGVRRGWYGPSYRRGWYGAPSYRRGWYGGWRAPRGSVWVAGRRW